MGALNSPYEPQGCSSGHSEFLNNAHQHFTIRGLQIKLFEGLSVNSHVRVFGENAERVGKQMINPRGAGAGCVGAVTHSTCV